MTVLSKLRNTVYGREWSFPYNCYEVGHAWTPFCSEAALDVGVSAFKNIIPLYTSLYLFTQLALQRKYDSASFLETAKSILTSSSFIGFNLTAGLVCTCLLRNNSDRYYYRTQVFLPGVIASYLALWVERPSRRPALAFYMANMSSELLFKWGASRGLFPTIAHGETVLFALGMSCFQHFIRLHGFGHDPVSSVLKFLIGPLEAKSRARKNLPPALLAADGQSSDKLLTERNQAQARINKPSTLAKLDKILNGLFGIFVGSHPACPHKNINCAHYVITPSVTWTLSGYLGRSLVSTLTKYQLLIKQPAEAFRAGFLSRQSLNFGLFLGLFVGSSKAAHCLLRRYSDSQQNWHSAVAGGLAGSSMLLFPKSTLSTYIIWKCLEQYFFLGVQQGKIKHPNQIIACTYAVSINVLLYMFALEPRFIRPSYMKFIDTISDHRLHQLNRMGKCQLGYLFMLESLFYILGALAFVYLAAHRLTAVLCHLAKYMNCRWGKPSQLAQYRPPP